MRGCKQFERRFVARAWELEDWLDRRRDFVALARLQAIHPEDRFGDCDLRPEARLVRRGVLALRGTC